MYSLKSIHSKKKKKSIKGNDKIQKSFMMFGLMR